MRAVVLAGERPGGNALARSLGLAAGVLAEVGGATCLERVVAALRASHAIAGGVLVGPGAPLPQTDARVRALLDRGDFEWLAPADGPSASALAGVEKLDEVPLLLTAGDHALLTPAIVDAFCTAAGESEADFVVGLVPYGTVQRAFPASRRTRLRFSDATWCGSNLFLLRTALARRALAFWRACEAQRKRPWRLAARIGPAVLLRYLAGRLSTAQAFAALSARSGAAIGFVCLEHARAAVDVDSAADLALAREVVGHG